MIDALLRRELVEAAVEVLPLVVVDLDSGTILHATKPAEEMLGYGVRGELVGQPAEVLADGPCKDAAVREALAYAADPQPRPLAVTELKLRHKGGLTVEVAVSLTPIKLTDRRCVVAVALPVGGGGQ